jgi:acyl-CoA synthetase (AMP-forming)/AMP-acid ligase II
MRNWPNRHLPEEAGRYRRKGLWRDLTMADGLAALLADRSDWVCLVDDAGRYTIEEIDRKARKLAGWFDRSGLACGDVVAFQLPNWHETAVIALAASLLGLVCLPIVPIYREAELRFILEDAGAKVFFVPRTFRNFHYAAMGDNLKRDVPSLVHVVAVRDEAVDDPFEMGEAFVGPARGRAEDPWMLMYTSGTTGKPKGVVHNTNSLDCEVCNVARWWTLDSARDVTLMASPVTHVTGFLFGILMPFALGIRSVLMERWSAEDAVGLVGQEEISFTMGATPFLRELLDRAEAQGSALSSLRIFACGGAPVPPELIERAWRQFPGLLACRVYGSTEAPTVSLGVASRQDLRAAANTEGMIVGHDVRIVDDEGRVVIGDGEIVTRGPEMMMGYLDPEDDQAAYDGDGYFRTGDIAHLDMAGFLVITDRKKDLIIRGGENISAKEVEDVLHEHPAILEAAVVAMPHARLGETCCAFLRSTDTGLDAVQLSRFLDDRGLARQKHPERVVVVAELPRTASGKVQKFLLRKRLQDEAQVPSEKAT